jgi:hypothetical protein
MAASFHAVGDVCMDKLRLQKKLKGTKISGLLFTTKLGIPSNPTNSVDSIRLIALLTSTLTEATANVWLRNKKGNYKTPEGVLLCRD